MDAGLWIETCILILTLITMGGGISEVLRSELARGAKFRICRSCAMSLAKRAASATAGTAAHCAKRASGASDFAQ